MNQQPVISLFCSENPTTLHSEGCIFGIQSWIKLLNYMLAHQDQLSLILNQLLNFTSTIVVHGHLREFQPNHSEEVSMPSLSQGKYFTHTLKRIINNYDEHFLYDPHCQSKEEPISDKRIEEQWHRPQLNKYMVNEQNNPGGIVQHFIPGCFSNCTHYPSFSNG